MNFVSTKIISNLLNQILMLYLQYMIKLCENLNFIQKGVLENNIKECIILDFDGKGFL